MRNRTYGYRGLLRKLALVTGSATLLLVTGAPASQASGLADLTSSRQAISSAVTVATPPPGPTPTPAPGPKHKNHTVTNPAPPGPGAPRPGLLPAAPLSLLGSALAAAGLAAPASSLPIGPCTLSATSATCELWATTGTITFPGSAPLVMPVWGFSTSSTPGTAAVPGPVLVANAGESIQITVHNALPAGPAGLNIPNRISIEVPASSSQPDLSGVDRNNARTYNFGSLPPGTYLYEAGPTPYGARQVKMGLAGILIVRPSNFDGPTGCNCAYANGAGAFVDESTLLLNEFDPAFNADPFNSDPVDFSPSEYTINGQAFDPTHPGSGKINVVSGDVLLLHYANLSEHERGITIANERQTILADDSYVLTNPVDVATKWLNPGQVSDSFVTIDPSFPPYTHVPVYDAGLHLSNGADSGLGGMFTYLDVVGGLAGNPNGPVTTVSVNPPNNSGIEDLTVSGTMTSGAGTTLTDAEWFLDNPGTPGSGPTCPTGGLSVTGGSGYTNPIVTIAAPGGSGGTTATATVSGKIDAINLGAHGGGYTIPSVSVAGTGGGSASVSGSVDTVTVGTQGVHYSAPSVGFSGGGGSGATATATGPVDSLTLGTNGAGYTSPSVVFGAGGVTAASASVTGSVDSVKLANGAGYTTPVVTVTGGNTTAATVSVSGGVDALTVGAGGSGYSATPIVNFTSVDGNGTGATATATVDSGTGAITGLSINTAGSGYTQAPTVSFSDSSGTGAMASATINLTAVSFVGGSGYSSAPSITITDSGSTGSGAAAIATISVTAISLGAPGSGYSSAPSIAIADTLPGGTGAKASATIAVTAVTMISGGSAYTSAPTVGFTDTASGTSAGATATLTITAIAISAPGDGYTNAPAITISDLAATGGGATVAATLTLDTITLTNPGSGYATAPLVSINDSGGGTGTGATATASQPATPCLYQHLAVSGGSANFSFTIASADLNTLLLSSLTRDGDHIIWVHGEDSNGTWGVVAGDVFAYNATGPVVGALTLHVSPTNGNRPTDVANGAGPADPLTGVPGNVVNTDLVVLGRAAASLSNFAVTAAEYCIDTTPCPALKDSANPSGPTPLVLTPSGSDGNQQIDANGNTLATPIACTPVASPPGVSAPGIPGAPGGGSIVSFCGTVPTSMLHSLAEGAHTLYIHACEQVSGSTGGCAQQAVARWAGFNADASIKFVIDRSGPAASALSIDPNPNNGFQISSGDLNFVDSLQFAATLSDPVVMGVSSNIAYGEVFVTCSPATQPATCKSTSSSPFDPATNGAPADGTGAEMFPSGAAWDSTTKLAYAYIPLAVLTEFPEGYVRFWVHAQDQAGNFGPWAYTDLTYDKTPPVITAPAIPVPPASPTSIACNTNTGCNIAFTAHDPASGGVNSNIVQAEWFIDAGATVVCTSPTPPCAPQVVAVTDPGYGNGTPIALTLPLGTTVATSFHMPRQPRGTHIVFRVRDAAGNWSPNNMVITR